jgi:hypothetical protein
VAIAVEDRRSGRTVIDDEAVIPVVYFKESSPRESSVVCVLHEPATHQAQLHADQALDPDRNKLAVYVVANVERFPVIDRKPHRDSDVFDGDNSGRRLEPASTSDADQVGLRGSFRVVEISRDTRGRMRKQCRQYATAGKSTHSRLVRPYR